MGIPLDIAVIGFVIYQFARKGAKVSESFSSAEPRPEPQLSPARARRGLARREDLNREFAQLRKFDPNFSEIVFTDFCYALYGKAHDARGRGQNALDQFSPYLSEGARKSLLGRNPSGLREVKGIIVGAMRIANVRGLETPVVKIDLFFETNYTEVVNAMPVK